MTQVAHDMRSKLQAALDPSHLEIVDDSDRHAGHSGARAGGESHFTLTIESAAFTGQGRLVRQRLIHKILADELAGPVHALSLNLRAPAEG